MAYVRVPVIVPKTKKGSNTFVMVLLCIMLPVMLIGCIALATDSATATVTDLTTYETMKSDETYYIQNLYVVDSYGEVETTYSDNTSAITEQCYLVGFVDQNGQFCYASLGVKNGSPIYEKCSAYAKGLVDGTQQIGSLAISGCFSIKTIESQMNQMELEYTTAYQRASLLLNNPGVDTKYHLNYEESTKEGYLEKNSTENTIGLTLCSIFTVLLAVGLFFAIRQRKKIKAEELAAKQAAQQMAQQFFVPPAPVQPAQAGYAQPTAGAPVVVTCPVCHNSTGNILDNGHWRCALCGTMFDCAAPTYPQNPDGPQNFA